MVTQMAVHTSTTHMCNLILDKVICTITKCWCCFIFKNMVSVNNKSIDEKLTAFHSTLPLLKSTSINSKCTICKICVPIPPPCSDEWRNLGVPLNSVPYPQQWFLNGPLLIARPRLFDDSGQNECLFHQIHHFWLLSIILAL